MKTWSDDFSSQVSLFYTDIQDQIAFVMAGSDNAVKYGVNGIGTGRMPGFGAVLSAADIELIVKYERSL